MANIFLSTFSSSPTSEKLSKYQQDAIHELFFTNRNTEDIFVKLRSLHIKFTPHIVVETLTIILEIGSSFWGGHRTVGQVLAQLPDEADPPFNNSLRSTYRYQVKTSFAVKLASTTKNYLLKLVDILSELFTLKYFEGHEIVEIIDGTACYILSKPSIVFHLLQISDAFQPIFTSKKYKQCCRAQVIQIAKFLSDSSTSKAFSPKNREEIAQVIEGLHVSADELAAFVDTRSVSDDVKKMVKNLKSGLEIDIRIKFGNMKLDAEYFMMEAMRDQFRMAQYAKFVNYLTPSGPKGFLFKDQILGMCQAGALNQLRTVSGGANQWRTASGGVQYLPFLAQLILAGVQPWEYFYDELDAVLLEKNIGPEDPNPIRGMFPRPVIQNPAPK